MVESYYNAELSDVIFDIDAKDEWTAISQELGLEKQLKFVSNSKSPMPYPFMNTSMVNVFATLCPAHVKLSEYKQTPIPLEVLKEIKFCIQENYYQEIEIWYDDKTPDPIAVGCITDYTAFYYETEDDKKRNNSKRSEGFKTEQEAKQWVLDNNYILYFVSSPATTRHLIARWGDELKPFNTLKELAKERLIEQYSNDYQKHLKELQNKLTSVKENVVLFLNGSLQEYDLRS